MAKQHKLQKITVISSYEDEYGYKEVYSPGFLTSEHHAMYHEKDTGEIVVTEVMPSRVPTEYISYAVYFPLGRLASSSQDNPDAVIIAVTKRLKEMTAYEFVTEVLVDVWETVEFEGLIIPGIL